MQGNKYNRSWKDPALRKEKLQIHTVFNDF